MKKTTLLTALLLCFGFALQAQSAFDIPEHVELKVKADYSKYEKTMVEACQWLENTDLDKEMDKRDRINQFVWQWISGSPTVNINLDEPLLRIVDKNPDLFGIFIARYSSYCIQHGPTASTFDATHVALSSVIKVYGKGINVSRNKLLEKLQKYSDEELDGFIEQTFKLHKA